MGNGRVNMNFKKKTAGNMDGVLAARYLAVETDDHKNILRPLGYKAGVPITTP
jgi:hypothetical protein